MDDDVRPPVTSFDADSDPVDIVYAIVHDLVARDIMARLARGESIDDLCSMDEVKVDVAVGLLQSVGVVAGDRASLVLTDRGRRLNDQFVQANGTGQ